MFHVEHSPLPYTVLHSTEKGPVVKNKFCHFLLSLTLLASSAPAFAGDELLAVERHCGNPGAESKETSPINGQLERTLIYNNVLYLHFKPTASGWSFTTAWNNHLPMTRNEVEGRLPCFRDAMKDAASTATTMDPTIAVQSAPDSSNEGAFGIPHFGLIVFLVITLLVFIVVPSARQRRLARQNRKPVEHIYRKPNLDEHIDLPPPPRPPDRDLD